jgi:hypothetical protein
MFGRSVLYARLRTNEPKEVGGHGPVITEQWSRVTVVISAFLAGFAANIHALCK